VSTAYINRWVDSLRDGIAPATVSVYWRNLRPFFSWWSKETGQPNPFVGADVPTVALEPPDVIHLDDIRALLDNCKGREFADRRDNDPCAVRHRVSPRRAREPHPRRLGPAPGLPDPTR
jgi:site-specific recombinase XerD